MSPDGVTIAQTLTRALEEVLEFQSANRYPTIHEWGRWRRIFDDAKRELKVEANSTLPHVFQLWHCGESEITQDPEQAERWEESGYTVHHLGRRLYTGLTAEELNHDPNHRIAPAR